MNASTTADTLTLAELRDFDPRGGHGPDQGKRWRCPFCQAPKRDLSVNIQTGAYKCQRASCGAKGKLKEYWQDRPRETPREARRARLRRAFDLQPVTPTLTTSDNNWRRHLDGLTKLDGTPGASYLNRRGISEEVVTLAGVRYSPRWFGRRSVVFPIRNEGGVPIAAHGRAIDSADKFTVGPKSQGIFSAHSRINGQIFRATDRRLPWIILTEAPIDALSLAMCGFPSIAMCGASGPAWLHLLCGLRNVLPATDADEAGDIAAEALDAQLTPFGAHCWRLRPEGAKDWNAMLLQIGCDRMSDWLTAHILELHTEKRDL